MSKKMTVERRPSRSERIPLEGCLPGEVVEFGDSLYLVTNDSKNAGSQIVLVSIPGGKVSFPRGDRLVRICPCRVIVEV